MLPLNWLIRVFHSSPQKILATQKLDDILKSGILNSEPEYKVLFIIKAFDIDKFRKLGFDIATADQAA